jgi:putative transposase
MPNHVHMVVVIRRPADAVATTANPVGVIPVGAIHELPLRDVLEINHKQRRGMTIPKIAGYYRMNVAKRINEIRNSLGIPVWQRNYFEHIIHDE